MKSKRKAEAGAIRNGLLAKSLKYLDGNQSNFALDTAIKKAQKQLFLVCAFNSFNCQKAKSLSTPLRSSLQLAICNKPLPDAKEKSKPAQSNFIERPLCDLRKNLKEAFNHE